MIKQSIFVDQSNEIITVVQVFGVINLTSKQTVFNYGNSRYIANKEDALLHVQSIYPKATTLIIN